MYKVDQASTMHTVTVTTIPVTTLLCENCWYRMGKHTAKNLLTNLDVLYLIL